MHDKASFCIEFDDAGVSRGGHIIWQHGTFRIPQGSVTAIVGTNGAGKTTTMRMLLGLTDTLEAVYPTVLVSYTVGVVVSLATSKKMHGLAKE